MPRRAVKPTPKHRFKVTDEVKIVKDLSGPDSAFVGRIAKILELPPTPGTFPQYKVLIFGEGKVIGGVFEVDEREIELHFVEKPITPPPQKRSSA